MLESVALKRISTPVMDTSILVALAATWVRLRAERPAATDRV
jgi:hypothetical protein